PRKLSSRRLPHRLRQKRRPRMHADPAGVLTGSHFLDGDHACCEGALAGGARLSAGYPITPSTEVVERFAARVPTVGGTFIQMEDELAASIAIQGAVWGGAKAFTVTSGPGFSLMMEHIGLADMTVTAFNYSEQYRCPVFVMMDEVVGHMTEKVVIPPPEQIEVTPRRYTTLPPDEFLAYQP